MRKLLMTTMLVVLLFATNLYAAPKSGDSEIEIFGDISNSNSITNYNVSGSYGYYFSPADQLGLGFGISGNSGNTGEEFEYRVNYKYFFILDAESLVRPFLEGGYVLRTSDAFTRNNGEVTGGIYQYVSDTTALTYRLGYRAILDDSNEDDQLFARIGIAFTF